MNSKIRNYPKLYRRKDGAIFKHTLPLDEFMQVLTIQGEWKNSPIRASWVKQTQDFVLISNRYIMLSRIPE